MFEKYIICEDGFRTTNDTGTRGVMEIRMPYYRGLGLSMVEAADLEIDGVTVPPSRTTFTVHGNSYRMNDLPSVLDDRWEMGERAELGFELDSPLAPGSHDVAVTVRLRVSYMPVPSGGRDRKSLILQS
ncbi:DUF6379 domain-containing protein [Actinoplanes sp. NPDC051470]|uniref:C-glycoside deglycosidase beta subunit domain-containing protein n=1 Tax=unclassified Actinoplanes TaxID=2626549 RepID=UPI003449B5CE